MSEGEIQYWNQMIANAQDLAFEAMQRRRISFIFRPALSLDGDQWCALFGDNLQNGVAGFGKSPDLAYKDFDMAWYNAIGKEAGNDKA